MKKPEDTMREELNELKEWLLAADKPQGKPKFVSTRFLISERSRSRLALECALDYQSHMGEVDVKGIKDAYEALSYHSQ